MTLLRLAARCPRCFHRPNIRLYPATVEKYLDAPPDQEVGSISCQRCGKIYLLTAKAYQDAAA